MNILAAEFEIKIRQKNSISQENRKRAAAAGPGEAVEVTACHQVIHFFSQRRTDVFMQEIVVVVVAPRDVGGRALCANKTNTYPYFSIHSASIREQEVMYM